MTDPADAPAPSPPSADPAQVSDADRHRIWEQLLFYFSDSNLPRDAFLRGKTEENPDGYVDLHILATFKRMKALGATPQLIADIVHAKADQDPEEGDPALSLNTDKTQIRRTTPVPTEQSEKAKLRTIYAKGWDTTQPEPPIEQVKAVFEKFGKVNCIRLRRRKAPNQGPAIFKGSAFIEYAADDAAKAAVAAPVRLDGADADMKILPLLDYIKQKQEERRAARQEAVDAKAKTRDSKDKSEVDVGAFTKGLVLRVEGIGPGVTREDVKELLENYGTVDWIDYSRDEADGYVRFGAEGCAVEAVSKLTEKKSELGGKVPEWSLLAGEQEEQYWKDVHAAKQAARVRVQKRKRDANNDRWRKRKAPAKQDTAKETAANGESTAAEDAPKENGANEDAPQVAK